LWTGSATGSEALDFDDIAAIASDLTGRTITRVTVPDEEWKQSLLGRKPTPFREVLEASLNAPPSW
jgi:hypothetical protein